MSILPIQGVIQHYDWGGDKFIPELLNLHTDRGEPSAEYWLGTHDRGPAMIKTDLQPVGNLRELLPEGLPFLLKVLDVHKMLSIQCHPNKIEAEKGFATENAAGIPLSAKYRNFRDDNHKPEAMYALSDFWLLHGFRNWTDIVHTFQSKTYLAPLLQGIKDVRSLFVRIIELPQSDVDALVQSLAEELHPSYLRQEIYKESHDYWAAKAIDQFTSDNGHDRGVLIIYLMNLVLLRPGDVIFQEANLLHAYLEGQNVEIMANSDNVLRAGLTSKHIDPQLLTDHLSFETKEVHLTKALDSGIYRFPIDDFGIEVISESTYHSSGGPEIILCMSGQCRLRSEDQDIDVSRGDSFFIPSSTDYQILVEESTQLFRAFSLL